MGRGQEGFDVILEPDDRKELERGVRCIDVGFQRRIAERG